jgi:RimJ/RimL family protein N-acetyltransferase
MTVALALLTRAHLPALAELARDPEVQRFTRVPTGDAVTGWLARYEAGRGNGTREAFAILDDTGAFAGAALAPRIDRDARTVELGYMVVPAFRRRGIATDALELLARWALAELGALRLELLIGTDNEASRIVARRAGFHREGVLRSLHVRDDLRADTEIWSRLPEDR